MADIKEIIDGLTKLHEENKNLKAKLEAEEKNKNISSEEIKRLTVALAEERKKIESLEKLINAAHALFKTKEGHPTK